MVMEPDYHVSWHFPKPPVTPSLDETQYQLQATRRFQHSIVELDAVDNYVTYDDKCNRNPYPLSA